MERRNQEKYRLIEMVYKRPILWDSSLPNFKGAEQEKSAAWTEISHEFNLTPQRAERSFKSLRESYRRELATQKQLGDAFKPKWEYFSAMDFLRSVIRERKANSSFDQKDFEMSQMDEFAYYVQHQDNVVPTVTSTSHRRNSSSTASGENITTTMTEVPVKKEHHFDDDEEVEELSPIDEDYPFPDIQLVSEHPPMKKVNRRSLLNNNNHHPHQPKQKRKRSSDEMLVTSNQSHNEKHMPPSSPPPSPPPATFINERAEFHDRFGNFVAAKLNTLKDNDANELMSKIFMLLFKH
ncbi:Mes2.2 family protein [Megaselia abdita]